VKNTFKFWVGLRDHGIRSWWRWWGFRTLSVRMILSILRGILVSRKRNNIDGSKSSTYRPVGLWSGPQWGRSSGGAAVAWGTLTPDWGCGPRAPEGSRTNPKGSRSTRQPFRLVKLVEIVLRINTLGDWTSPPAKFLPFCSLIRRVTKKLRGLEVHSTLFAGRYEKLPMKGWSMSEVIRIRQRLV